MRVYNRVLALLFAMCLVVNLAFFPFRARAAGVGALAAVAGVTVLGTYLMACGIFPYMTEAGQNLTEWTSDSLQPLLDKYNDYLSSIGKSYAITLQGNAPTVKGYLAQGVVMIANDIWGKLREFVTWLQSEYALTDNQTGVELVVGGTLAELPAVSPFGYNSIVSSGLFAGKWRRDGRTYDVYSAADNAGIFIAYCYDLPVSDVFDYASQGLGSYHYGASLVLAGLSTSSADYASFAVEDWNSSSTSYSPLYRGNRPSQTYKGVKFVFSRFDFPIYASDLVKLSSSVPVYSTLSLFLDDILSGSGNVSVMIDTATVAPLEALPDGTEWGGLAIEGVGVAASPAVVNDTIGGAIVDREKPVVRPVEVEIQVGTDVDAETGAVTEDVVTVTPEDVIPTVAALSPPASFLSALQTTMTTKFPFCLPFDIARILMAFYVAPEAPVISLTFHDPFTDSDYTITVDLSPWDNVAAVVRNFEAMILLAGFCLNFDKFNIIHLILGGLG